MDLKNIFLFYDHVFIIFFFHTLVDIETCGLVVEKNGKYIFKYIYKLGRFLRVILRPHMKIIMERDTTKFWKSTDGAGLKFNPVVRISCHPII